MKTFDEFISKNTLRLWQPLSVDMALIDSDYDDYEEDIRIQLACLFDINEVPKYDIEDLIEDIFNDGFPDGFSLDTHKPFAFLGGVLNKERIDKWDRKGDLFLIDQPSHMLFFNLKSGSDNERIMLIEIDGTAIEDSIKYPFSGQDECLNFFS